MAVYLDVDAGNAVRIGADTVIHVEKKSGNRVRLRIETEYKVRLENKSGTTTERPNASRAPNTTLTRPIT